MEFTQRRGDAPLRAIGGEPRMGIDDRDYMRERQRARSGSTRWNDRAGRVEGARLDPAIRSFDYQRGRWRGSRRSSPVRYLPFALSLLIILIPLYGDA